jgi:hypothetical protein
MTKLRGNPWAVLVVVSLGFFMTLLDKTFPGAPAGSAAPVGTSPGLAAQLRRLGAEVFGQGYVHAMRWTMVLPIAVVALATASCLLLGNKASGQGPATAADASTGSGQMAGTISSPGSSGSLGQSPGSSSGTAS